MSLSVPHFVGIGWIHPDEVSDATSIDALNQRPILILPGTQIT